MGYRGKPIEYKTNENGCYICTSHYVFDDRAYPRFMRNGKRIRLNRLVYEENFGPIPEGMVVRHKCDNRMCINPEHLELGTNADNVKDRVDRKRSAIGEQNGRSKLTLAQAREIKYDTTTPNKALARKFGVDPKSIRDIKQGNKWREA